MIILFSLLNMSCLNEEIIEINENKIETKAIEEELCNLNVFIINKANNVILSFNEFKIDGLEEEYINNNEYTLKESDTLNIKIPNIKHQILPKGSKVIINGSIKTETYTIYDGTIIIPIEKNINKKENILNLMLYSGCPWYTEDGYGILQEIGFNVTINDWYEENDTIIFN